MTELTFNRNDYELQKFYSYASEVADEIYVYDEFEIQIKHKEKKPEDCLIVDLFEKLCRECELKYTHVMFRDNKTAYQLKNINTGEIFFIGFKDSIYSMGKSCFQHYGFSFDIRTGEMKKNEK